MTEEPKEGKADSCNPEDVCCRACALLTDWKNWARENLKQVETFTKEKPVASLSISFVIGFFVASWLRRK